MMRTLLILGLWVTAIAFFAPLHGQKRELKNPLFIFNNGLNKAGHDTLPYEKQAALLKLYGFDGLEWRETKGLLDMKKELDKWKLKVYADYVRIDIDSKEPYSSEWKKVIPKLKGSGIILWVHLHSAKFKPSDESADNLVVPIIQELADFAKPYGVKLAIYHHYLFLAESPYDSYRIATKANRDNVGAVFNLPHFLRTNSEENIKDAIDKIFPRLFAVSVCGSDGGGDTRTMGWDRLIQPLGEGSFDTYRVVEYLADKGYTGPVGLQCYNLKGAPESYMKKSGDAWKAFRKRYSEPLNTLTKKEKGAGWELLFDGKSTSKWRGINDKTFPASGWSVANGELCITGNDVLAESKKTGDIVTLKPYGNFEFSWEWKMLTKGGNSGVKYFVLESLSTNPKHGEGLEYQLLDDKNHPWMLDGKMVPNDYHTVGSLYELYAATPAKMPSPLGLWNHSRVVCKNNHVEHWLNGVKVLEFEKGSEDFKARVSKSKMATMPGFGLMNEGLILLQDHGSIVHFRNLKIKDMQTTK